MDKCFGGSFIGFLQAAIIMCPLRTMIALVATSTSTLIVVIPTISSLVLVLWTVSGNMSFLVAYCVLDSLYPLLKWQSSSYGSISIILCVCRESY